MLTYYINAFYYTCVLSAIDTVRKKLQGYHEYYIIAVVDNMVMDYYYYYYLQNSPTTLSK